MGNAAANNSLNAAYHKASPSNKITPWSTTALIKVETDMAKTDNLVNHPSSVTYGWTVTALTAANLLATNAFKGWSIVPEGGYKVRVETDQGANKLQCFGVGASTSIYASWKLKTIKRYKGATAGKDLSAQVSADTARWAQKSNGSVAANKFYTVGSKCKISVNEATGTKTDHISSTVVVIPRSASDVKINSVLATEANTGSAFLKHDVCLREKTTGTVCPVGTAVPAVGVQIPNTQAKFFSQIWTVANGNTDVFDKVEWASEWDVVGDCTATATIAKCKTFWGTFGAETATATSNKFYITQNSNASGWQVEYDAKPLSNTVSVALDVNAKVKGTMTNKVTAWTGVIPKIKVESSASKTNSLDKHPSTTTYGFTVTTLTSAALFATARVG
jgi:hypothetical protein